MRLGLAESALSAARRIGLRSPLTKLRWRHMAMPASPMALRSARASGSALPAFQIFRLRRSDVSKSLPRPAATDRLCARLPSTSGNRRNVLQNDYAPAPEGLRVHTLFSNPAQWLPRDLTSITPSFSFVSRVKSLFHRCVRFDPFEIL